MIDAEYKSRFFDSDPHRKSYVSENPDRLSEFEVEQLRKELFEDCIAGEEVPEDVQCKVQRYLIEFAVGYRSSGTNSEVMPTTMKTYILGIQRVFNEWGFELKLTAPFAKHMCGFHRAISV